MIVLALVAKFTKIYKTFLIITGSSAACIFFSIVSLAWIIQGIFAGLFGGGSNSGWAANGVVILFQVVLLAGAIGSMVLIAKKQI